MPRVSLSMIWFSWFHSIQYRRSRCTHISSKLQAFNQRVYVRMHAVTVFVHVNVYARNAAHVCVNVHMHNYDVYMCICVLCVTHSIRMCIHVYVYVYMYLYYNDDHIPFARAKINLHT